MLTLLGSLLGFLSSNSPYLLKLWQEGAGRIMSWPFLDRQMERIKLGGR